MTLGEALPLINEAANLLAWVLGIFGFIISTLIAIIWRSRAVQTDRLIATSIDVNQSISILNVTMLEVRDDTRKQWVKIASMDRDIAVLKNQNDGKSYKVS